MHILIGKAYSVSFRREVWRFRLEVSLLIAIAQYACMSLPIVFQIQLLPSSTNFVNEVIGIITESK